AVLWLIRPKRQFEGQLFLLYLILYALVRGLLEILRGDVERGFVIEGILSHSQFISLIVIAAAVFAYVKLKRRATLLS
ncbi:MAG: prolipoprotein diacylglyceryl transferase family protein, partial [Cyclobacteriaceae bacterium]